MMLISALLFVITLIMLAYGIRHYILAINRLFSRQKMGFEGLTVAQWPTLTVFIAAHNEEAVVGHCIEALLKSDYPLDRLSIIPVNDRSTDGTRDVCDYWALRYPYLIKPFHRNGGRAGKPAALMDAARNTQVCDVYVIFDADYLPAPGLLKQIVAPLFDPLVGVTMGRVVPQNMNVNLLTRLLDMERSAGYQGDQQARQNMGLLPQFGGTVGAIRVRALELVGGFREDVLAEDTDLTFRLLDNGWRVQYVNTAECYEEVPENWPVRVRQLQRWAKGHNQVLYGYFWKSLGNRHLNVWQKLDAIMLLGSYSVAPLTLLGWGIILLTWFYQPSWLLTLSGTSMLLVMFGGFGNVAAFYQMAVAVRLDGNSRRLRLLPLTLMGYLISAVTIFRGAANLFLDTLLKRELRWDKTVRFRGQAKEKGDS
ncbi:glycosyltransferase family 2 protein [Salmonella enterica]|nr:glycosyltransferase family 2 protein [Salmonella enterica]EDR1539079.1 glycosyltransferase family 2 protein [Salmonella enterica subsp. enterica serovar Javiana]EGO3302068.1 glycosyltransferase family 2 protein [Salmonella enterica]EHC5972833.1 glycosyltransferase family 2 protein [Salmonella enterica]EIU9581243.1 glycosyltransferase family 2 protein [Salmonella enterica]